VTDVPSGLSSTPAEKFEVLFSCRHQMPLTRRLICHISIKLYFLKSFPLHVSAYLTIIKCYNPCGAETAVLIWGPYACWWIVVAITVTVLGHGAISCG
jgi:hypothetical protein